MRSDSTEFAPVRKEHKMTVIKNNRTGKWEVRTYYKNLKGETKQKTKRGFERKADAQDWERAFKLKDDQNINMYFRDFIDLYEADVKPRLKVNSWNNKRHIIEAKILPYFGHMRMNEIRPSDVIKWQNEMMKQKKANGEYFSKPYLNAIHNQLTAIFNHAVNLYDLKSNPARKAGPMGCPRDREMKFWTREEYQLFSDAIADKPISYYAFELLYWTGIRLGELLALTKADFNFEDSTLRINKSYQKINGEDVITEPKTKKSIRTINLPEFLCDEMKEFFASLYGIGKHYRLFLISKSYLHHEIDRGVKASGVKRIRVHDLRHSHVSLLIDMGYSALAISQRMGHEAIDITLRYAHLFPTVQLEMAEQLNKEKEMMLNVRKES